MTKNYVLAHDLGTTGTKASLFDRDGRMIDNAFSGYETVYAHTNWAEQNPEDWWKAVCLSTRKLLQATRVDPQEIACVAFSGQMMGCVPIDRAGKPLRNAIIWADQRSVEEDRWLEERISKAEVYRITGHRVGASTTLCKILWLREHDPDSYRAAAKFVQAKDAIVARLTGNLVTDRTDASSTNLYELDTANWSERILDAAGLDQDKMPQIRLSTDVVGYVLSSIAEEVGLAAGTPVVIGGGDGVAAAVGAGVVREGSAFTYIGSSGWIALTTAKPVYEPDFKTYTFAHMVPDKFCPCGAMQAAGGSYAWTRNELGMAEVQAAEALGLSPYELMNLQVERSRPGADGLIFLPYLIGERSPHWNPRARGAFVGLTIRHSRADMFRAVLEGITMNLDLVLRAFLKQGVPIQAMRVVGGGARGRVWNQLMADIYGMPVQRLAVLEEATSMGAAVAGGVGVGLYPDFSIVDQMNRVADVINPDPEAMAVYETMRPWFEATYQALVPIFERMAQ
ncbi:MAG: xylulokinase [Anaerolineae bacterium]|nr:xylulokinase [Anaerolineae bacterium]